ncbi:type IV pilus twitching motility protein PilT [Elusimicrobiota bacterium]
MTPSELLQKLMKMMLEVNASDLHLRPNSKPIIRLNKSLRLASNFEILSDEDMGNLIEFILNDEQLKEFKETHEIDLSFCLRGLSRYRVNAFMQRGLINIVMRLVPDTIKTIDDIQLPESIKKISMESRGLILVTGTTGSGKSTTLAAMIDHINSNSSKHIITIEDPIEFIHKDKKSIVSQRELDLDTFSFEAALKHIVRQDPDVILVGEMRDPKTMATAITAAETGHLVLSTIHTINAMQTVTRIVDIFPPHQQNQIRLQLADSLCAVVSQRLLPRKDNKGMIPAVEILVATGLIRTMIEENTISDIHEQMEKGAYYGMQTFNHALELLYKEGHVTLDAAKEYATNPEDLVLRIKGIKSESGAQ